MNKQKNKIDAVSQSKIDLLYKQCNAYCTMHNLTGGKEYKNNAIKCFNLAKEIYENSIRLYDMGEDTQTIEIKG